MTRTTMIFHQLRQNERQSRRRAVRQLIARAEPFHAARSIGRVMLAVWVVGLAIAWAIYKTAWPYIQGAIT